MTKLQQLRDQRDAKAKAAHELNSKHPADKRMPADAATQLDALLAEVEAIDDEIKRELRANALAAPAEGSEEERERALNAATRNPGQHDRPAENSALKSFLQGGLAALTNEQRTAMNARVNSDIRAAMSTSTNTEGGYTTAVEYQRTVEKALKEFGGMRAVASVFQTGTGNQMGFPTGDATSEEGEIVGQNAAVNSGETTFGMIALDVFKYSSKKIALPFELLQDSFIDIEAYIREILQMRLGRIQNRHYTVGTGVAQPKGLVPASDQGKVGANGQTATVIYDDLVDLEHSVDPAYRGMPGVGFMMHDSSLKVVRKIKDGSNRPIFVPGYEQGNPGGAPDRLMGRPIYINQDVATMAANAKSILFGVYSKYKIRDVMDLTLFRMTDSAFTLNGQVGFVAFMRSGGNLVSISGTPNAVKHYANSAA